jgi:hypothetical protein
MWCLRYALLCLAVAGGPFELRFRTDVQRLNNASVHCGNHIRSTIEIAFSNTGFPCVRKASFDSRLAVTHHGDGYPHEDFFTLAQVRDGMGIPVELSKIGFVAHGVSPLYPLFICNPAYSRVQLTVLLLLYRHAFDSSLE